MYACKKITRSSKSVKRTEATNVTADNTVQPLNCQKKKSVAAKIRARIRCPDSIFAIRRIVRVTGRRMNVEMNSIGTTMMCIAAGIFGITTEDFMNLKNPYLRDPA